MNAADSTVITPLPPFFASTSSPVATTEGGTNSDYRSSLQQWSFGTNRTPTSGNHDVNADMAWGGRFGSMKSGGRIGETKNHQKNPSSNSMYIDIPNRSNSDTDRTHRVASEQEHGAAIHKVNNNSAEPTDKPLSPTLSTRSHFQLPDAQRNGLGSPRPTHILMQPQHNASLRSFTSATSESHAVTYFSSGAESSYTTIPSSVYPNPSTRSGYPKRGLSSSTRVHTRSRSLSLSLNKTRWSLSLTSSSHIAQPSPQGPRVSRIVGEPKKDTRSPWKKSTLR